MLTLILLASIGLFIIFRSKEEGFDREIFDLIVVPILVILLLIQVLLIASLKAASICEMSGVDTALAYYEGVHTEDEFQEFRTSVILP